MVPASVVKLKFGSRFATATPNLGTGKMQILFGLAHIWALIKRVNLLLIGRALAFPWLRNGRNELGAATLLDDPLRRLAVVIKLPMACRVFVRGI